MKKNIPLAILEIFQPFIDANNDIIQAEKNTGALFYCADRDQASNFYFKVLKPEVRAGVVNYLIEYRPKNNHNTDTYSILLPYNDIISTAEKWVKMIKSYNVINTIYDDPILKANEKKFEESFRINDEDADYVSFDLSQQIFIDDYLKNVKEKLLALQAERSESEIKELNHAIDNATEIQRQLTRETKTQIIKRLAKFWAQTQKIGLDVIKDIFVNVAAELTKKLITGGN